MDANRLKELAGIKRLDEDISPDERVDQLINKWKLSGIKYRVPGGFEERLEAIFDLITDIAKDIHDCAETYESNPMLSSRFKAQAEKSARNLLTRITQLD